MAFRVFWKCHSRGYRSVDRLTLLICFKKNISSTKWERVATAIVENAHPALHLAPLILFTQLFHPRKCAPKNPFVIIAFRREQETVVTLEDTGPNRENREKETERMLEARGREGKESLKIKGKERDERWKSQPSLRAKVAVDHKRDLSSGRDVREKTPPISFANVCTRKHIRVVNSSTSTRNRTNCLRVWKHELMDELRPAFASRKLT